MRSRATRVAYGVGGGRDVPVGAQGAVVRAVLAGTRDLLGPAISGGGHELLGQLRAIEVLRERRHRAREQHIDFFGGQR